MAGLPISLVLVSDGVPEAMSRAHELFGRAGGGRILAAMPSGLGTEKRVNVVNSEVRKFSEGTEMADDVTVLVVRWHGPKRVTSDERFEPGRSLTFRSPVTGDRSLLVSVR